MRQKNIEQKEEYEQLEVIEKPVIVDKTDISKLAREQYSEREKEAVEISTPGKAEA